MRVSQGPSRVTLAACPVRCTKPWNLLSQVNVEVVLTARYWTRVFAAFVGLTYICTYLFMLVYMWVDTSYALFDPAQYGVIYQICRNPSFWLTQVTPPHPHAHIPLSRAVKFWKVAG